MVLGEDFNVDFGVTSGTWPALMREATRSFAPTSSSLGASRRSAARGPPRPDALGRQEDWEASPEGARSRRTSGGTATTNTGRRRGVIVGAHVAGVPVEELLPTAGRRRRRAARWHARVDVAAPPPPPRRPAHDRRPGRSGWSAPTARPPTAVFDAWTSEEVLRRWFHAERDWETPEAAVDLRVGRRACASSCATRAPATSTAAAGATRRSTRPRRLAFTWLWDDADAPGTLIEIDFEEADGVDDRPLHATAACGARRPCARTRAAGAGASTTWRRRWRRADGEHPEVTAIPLT